MSKSISSSSSGGGGDGGASSESKLAGTSRQTKGSSTHEALLNTGRAVHAMPASGSASSATSNSHSPDSSSTDVTAAYAVAAVLDFTCQLAAHTSHTTQTRPSLCTKYITGPERELQVVAWDQHAAELALLLEQLVRLEAEQPGLLTIGSGSDRVRQYKGTIHRLCVRLIFTVPGLVRAGASHTDVARYQWCCAVSTPT